MSTPQSDTNAHGELVIPARFRGPAESGNGGWVSGAIAEHVRPGTTSPGSVTVRLRTPPPLERRLRVTRAPDGQVTVSDGETQVAVAHASDPMQAPDLPTNIGYDMALAAGEHYRGLTDHPFPSCFSCGTGRAPAEALNLRTGPVPERPGLFATAWTPTEVTVPIVWAALDCPGAWAGDVAGRPMVLGTMRAGVDRLPAQGEPHVILSWTSGEQGRKVFSHCVLLAPNGHLLAQSEATWILVDPASIRPH